MRNRLFFAILTSVTICAGCRPPKPDMPDFKLLLLDSTTIIHTRDIPTGNPSILIFFSPFCEHCQQETAELLKKIGAFSSVNIYFITIEPMHDMRVFNGYYKLFRYPNITVARDYTFFLPGHIKKIVPPYSMIYDRYKRFKAAFSGQASAAELVKIINKI